MCPSRVSILSAGQGLGHAAAGAEPLHHHTGSSAPRPKQIQPPPLTTKAESARARRSSRDSVSAPLAGDSATPPPRGPARPPALFPYPRGPGRGPGRLLAPSESRASDPRGPALNAVWLGRRSVGACGLSVWRGQVQICSYSTGPGDTLLSVTQVSGGLNRVGGLEEECAAARFGGGGGALQAAQGKGGDG